MRRRGISTRDDLKSGAEAAAFSNGLPPGDVHHRELVDELFSVTYEELRRIAAGVKHRDSRAPVSTTTLVNEAWLKLANSSALDLKSQLHFKRIAARAMRQILVEAARRRSAHKRGGSGEALFITLADFPESAVSCDRELLALNEALDELADLNPRQASLVESRYFGGLDVCETAALLEVSEATVLRDWRAAKAWLAAEIRRRS